jgi:hypothetical protein
LSRCRCSGRVSFVGAAPPFAFRRVTLERAVAETVALFEAKDLQQETHVVPSTCQVLAQVLETANASVFLPNFVAAEFNDNDGAPMLPLAVTVAARSICLNCCVVTQLTRVFVRQ